MAKEKGSEERPASESPELGDLVEGLAQAERARRRQVVVVGVVLATVVALGGALVFYFRAEVFQPKMDIAGGEAEVIELTNDPQCRAFVGEVGAVGTDYFGLEPTFEGLLEAEPEAVVKMREEIEGLRERLLAAEASVGEINLRFDESPGELDDWFRHVKNELGLLDRLAAEQLPEPEPEPEPEADPEAEGDAEAEPVEGTVVRQAPAKPAKKFESKKKPQERLDGALLAINDAFQSFRVWHTGGLHPCGAAEPGEEPWTPAPEGASAAAKQPSEQRAE